MNTLSIVIPVFNEMMTIERLLDRVRMASTLGLKEEIIVVDDYSTDGTREYLQQLSGAGLTGLTCLCSPVLRHYSRWSGSWMCSLIDDQGARISSGTFSSPSVMTWTRPMGTLDIVIRFATINHSPTVRALETKGYDVRDSGRGTRARAS